MNTLTGDQARSAQLVGELFGIGPEDVEEWDAAAESGHWASRLIVEEAVLKGVQSRVQTRIRVDRFTGGAMENYLFNEAPVFGGDGSCLTLNVTLRAPREYEIGLLLLLLKDLWTGDLPLGGESSVGRGRLQGQSAKLRHVQGEASTTWNIEQVDGGLEITAPPDVTDDRDSLEHFVAQLNAHLAGEVQDET